MASSHHNAIGLVLTMASAVAVGSTTACTPASPDSPVAASTGASSGAAPSTGGSGGAGGSGSGGSTDVGGSSSSGAAGGSSGATGSGSGGTPNDSDAGASVAATPDAAATSAAVDGSSGSTAGDLGGGSEGGVTSAGDAATAPTGDGGCNWVQNADGTWNFDPASPDKVVLFDGSSLDNWHKENEPTVPIQWTLNNDGTMTVVPSGTGVATLIQSNQKFDNLCVHVEYMTPMYASDVTGQQRGNSGVYLKSAYEMQILDSYGDPPDINTCGAVYSIMKPLVVACHMELVWNTYEIEFKSSVWNTATPPVKTQNAEFIKVALNGQIVQLNVELNPAAGYTPAGIPDAPGPQPLGLQDHLCYVSFRNIWVRVPQY